MILKETQKKEQEIQFNPVEWRIIQFKSYQNWSLFLVKYKCAEIQILPLNFYDAR